MSKANLRAPFAPKPSKPVRCFHHPPSLLRRLLLKRSMEEEQHISVGTLPLGSPKRRKTSVSVGSNRLDSAGGNGPPSSSNLLCSEKMSAGSNDSFVSFGAVDQKRCMLERALTKRLVEMVEEGLISETEMAKTAACEWLEKQGAISIFLNGDTKYQKMVVKAACEEVKQGAINKEP